MKYGDFIDELRRELPQMADWVGDDWDDELAYSTFPRAVEWLADEVLKGTWATTMRVRPGREDDMRAFWSFVERAAETGDHDVHNLLQIELFEGIWWTEDVIDWLGPRTRGLLREAQESLKPYNSMIGRRREP